MIVLCQNHSVVLLHHRSLVSAIRFSAPRIGVRIWSAASPRRFDLIYSPVRHEMFIDPKRPQVPAPRIYARQNIALLQSAE
jgi:hypothetical protein